MLGLGKSQMIGYWMEGSPRKTKEMEETVWAVFYAQLIVLDGADALCILP